MTTAAAKRTRRRRPARGRTVLPPDPPRTAHPLDRLTIDGRSSRKVLGDRLVGAHRNPTIEGPTPVVLDVWDGDGLLLSSGLLGKRILSRVVTIRVNGQTYVVRSNSRSGGVLSLQCEHRNVARARAHGFGKPIKQERTATNTRAHFCAQLLRGAGVPVIVLDENVVQATVGDAVKAEKASSSKTRTRSAKLAGELTVKGAKATPAQRRVMAKVMAAALKRKPSPRALLALIAACIVEDQFRNSSVQTDHTSRGVLQLLTSTAAGLGISQLDIDACVGAFLLKGFYGKGGAIKLARENPGWTAGQIAQACQGSAYPDRYDQVLDEARKIIAAGGGDLASGDGAEEAVFFERKKDEGTYTACRRLLDEVQWRLFEREGVFVIATDKALMRAAPSLIIDATGPDTDGQPDFEQLAGEPVSEANARILVSAYRADPGEVVRIVNQSQLDERWLLQDASVDLTGQDPWVDVTVIQPREALPEPAAELADGASSDASDGSGGSVKAAAKKISAAGGAYVYGGGHGPKLASLDPKNGLDCSSSSSLALFEAGLFDGRTAAIVSGEFASSYGKPGQGKEFTVWANAEHVFILGANDEWRFDTGGPGGGRGPRFYDSSTNDFPVKRSTAGFTPRHHEGH